MLGAAKFLELLPWLGVHWCWADKGFWACGEEWRWSPFTVEVSGIGP